MSGSDHAGRPGDVRNSSQATSAIFVPAQWGPIPPGDEAGATPLESPALARAVRPPIIETTDATAAPTNSRLFIVRIARHLPQAITVGNSYVYYRADPRASSRRVQLPFKMRVRTADRPRVARILLRLVHWDELETP